MNPACLGPSENSVDIPCLVRATGCSYTTSDLSLHHPNRVCIIGTYPLLSWGYLRNISQTQKDWISHWERVGAWMGGGRGRGEGDCKTECRPTTKWPDECNPHQHWTAFSGNQNAENVGSSPPEGSERCKSHGVHGVRRVWGGLYMRCRACVERGTPCRTPPTSSTSDPARTVACVALHVPKQPLHPTAHTSTPARPCTAKARVTTQAVHLW